MNMRGIWERSIGRLPTIADPSPARKGGTVLISRLAIIGVMGFAMTGGRWARAEGTDCADANRFGEVSRDELVRLLEKKAVFVVDVNSSKSFRKERIPTAIHYLTHKGKLKKLFPTDKSALIVAYCGGPSCSAWKWAAKKACELGYTNVKHFKGGISGWTQGL